MTNGKQLYSGLCLLTDYKNFAEVVDGDTVSMPAYPNGEFTYTSVNGSARTVRVFTTNMDKVKVLPTAAEWKVICRPLE